MKNYLLAMAIGIMVCCSLLSIVLSEEEKHQEKYKHQHCDYGVGYFDGYNAYREELQRDLDSALKNGIENHKSDTVIIIKNR